MRSETPEPPKSLPPQDNSSPEALIVQNGSLVEELFGSQVWQEIAQPLLAESIAGVSGRFTNGRYWHGTLTTDWKGEMPLFLAGYQKALMDYHNRLQDFVAKKHETLKKKKEEVADAKAPLYNPYLESLGETQED